MAVPCYTDPGISQDEWDGALADHERLRVRSPHRRSQASQGFPAPQALLRRMCRHQIGGRLMRPTLNRHACRWCGSQVDASGWRHVPEVREAA